MTEIKVPVNISPNIILVMNRIRSFGGRPYIVGGFVRDLILGVPSKDIDIEVYRMPGWLLKFILKGFDKVNAVGKAFGVYHLVLKTGEQLDFSLPRKDSKIDYGYRGFQVKTDPWLSPKEAARRRDYTFNAMLLTKDGTIIDYYGGIDDLHNHVLRHTSSAFLEDPLRVLRGMQFCGRFGLKAAPETTDIAFNNKSEYWYLSLDRIWTEWEKWASKSYYPGLGLQFLSDSGWVELYQELDCIVRVPQDPGWHPEGDVYTHTCYTTDAMAEICRRKSIVGEERLIRMFAALLHDTGKASTTTKDEDGHIRSKGHEEVGMPLAVTFLRCIGAPNFLIETVPPLVGHHLDYLSRSSAKSIRRLAVALKPATLEQLVDLIEADHGSRPPLPAGLPPEATHLLEIAIVEKVTNRAQVEILMGRHLIDRGMKPSPAFKPILQEAYDAQLEGLFNDLDGAQVWLDTYLEGANNNDTQTTGVRKSGI